MKIAEIHIYQHDLPVKNGPYRIREFGRLRARYDAGEDRGRQRPHRLGRDLPGGANLCRSPCQGRPGGAGRDGARADRHGTPAVAAASRHGRTAGRPQLRQGRGRYRVLRPARETPQGERLRPSRRRPDRPGAVLLFDRRGRAGRGGPHRGREMRRRLPAPAGEGRGAAGGDRHCGDPQGLGGDPRQRHAARGRRQPQLDHARRPAGQPGMPRTSPSSSSSPATRSTTCARSGPKSSTASTWTRTG